MSRRDPIQLSNSRTDAPSRSRGMMCPGDAAGVSLQGGGRREDRMPEHPQARVREICAESTRVTTGTPKHAGLPCAMVLTAAPRSPWCTGLVSHHRPGIISQGLTPASGGQDHTAWPSEEMPSSARQRAEASSRPPHPASNVRDDRDTPLLWRRDARIQSYISEKRKRYIFAIGAGHVGQIRDPPWRV
jgi:hypothetical protein